MLRAVLDRAKVPMSSPVLVARSGDIATVAFNRPKRLNALDLTMWQALAASM